MIFTGLAWADPPPAGTEFHPFNPAQQQPVTKDGVTDFHLAPGLCSSKDYGDGRGENDCNNGNLRSVLRWKSEAHTGDTVEYKFDLKIDPKLTYPGFKSMAALGYYPNGIDSHLRLASWEGPFLHNFIYMLKADTTNGVSFLAQQCQAPADFGTWLTFSLKVHWSAGDDGWAKATCNGKVIYGDEAIATNQAPHCWPSNQCEPGVPKDPKSFNFLVGPVMSGFGPDWKKIPGAKSLFDEIQPDGIGVQVRNLSVLRKADLYDAADREAVKQLQQKLAALGCNAEAPDGTVSPALRQKAQDCRKFPDGTLPAKLTVATLHDYLALYSRPDTASLPAGTGAAKPAESVASQFVVHAAEESAQNAGKDQKVNSNMEGTIKGAKKGENKLFFILFGQFDFKGENFSELEYILQDNLDKKAQAALAACDAPTVTYPDGTVHLRLVMLKRSGDIFAKPKSAACSVKALPPGQAAEARFLLDHFPDIAVGMVKDKTVNKMRHDGAKTFMKRVAAGEITFVDE
ncbi:hypothetical protein F8B91_07810 [Aestuariivirga litoralis]|nr:hypothetical protein [Aestuariivirga litoralis]